MSIKELRERAGLSVSGLAAKAGVSSQTIYRIETGIPVSKVFVARVCNALGVAIEDVQGLNIKEKD